MNNPILHRDQVTPWYTKRGLYHLWDSFSSASIRYTKDFGNVMVTFKDELVKFANDPLDKTNNDLEVIEDSDEPYLYQRIN
eukprot:TRINITY_DN5721_c0_g1_i1.p1 TRINITY_DN5721_c0_g1~~TRINITY_DN5721_c0_g1_i1.p1  ORF type:complete len:81 (-),score=18.51 TRINITY_DN5721_c0_g1_i1:53-295(-)